MTETEGGALDVVEVSLKEDGRVQVWDAEGEELVPLTGPPLPETPDTSPTDSPETYPKAAIQDLGVDDSERLWVLVWEVREHWRAQSEERQSGGRTGPVPMDRDLANWFRSRIDVFDVPKAARLATIRFEGGGVVSTFVGESMILESSNRSDGTPRLDVWRLDMEL